MRSIWRGDQQGSDLRTRRVRQPLEHLALDLAQHQRSDAPGGAGQRRKGRQLVALPHQFFQRDVHAVGQFVFRAGRLGQHGDRGTRR